LTYRFSWEGPNRPSRWEVVESKIERDAELRQLRSKLDNLRELHLENQRLRGELEAVRTDAEGVWRWQGEGDDLQSLSCPVVVRADKMREIVGEMERLRNFAEKVRDLGNDEEHEDDCEWLLGRVAEELARLDAPSGRPNP
jgi:hypothetical protein